ncbi:zinc finger BED domain-containing protein RICESLEEPER 2-like [Canna indica]|uniref:Zinc finger BED domain-containing protein RICESLEEPER 2-like n=1 Tax=Canna indica TaxID=4628 RepID=A0AAQ3KGT7_9LILI|nr:zinc finger BED domain-containing protein RICESLEEPER 2-like [Canna indica]
MVLTGHFVDANWRLQKRVLNFVHIPPPHRGVEIADTIYKCLEEWGIEIKVYMLSVDNASNNDSAIQILKDTFSRSTKLICGGKLFHVRCCAHILNLMVQDGLSEVKHIIEDIHDSVMLIKVRLGFEFSQRLCINSNYLIGDSSWNAKHVGTQHTRCWLLQLSSRKHFRDLEIESLTMILVQLKKIGRKLGRLLQFWKYLLSQMYSEQAARENITKVRETLFELYGEYEVHYYSEQEGNETSTLCSDIGNSIGHTFKTTGWDEYTRYVKSVETGPTKKSDLDRYLEEGCYIHEGDPLSFDTLSWWKGESGKYRILSSMARDILAIPITTVASEATFSADTRVIDPYRSSLSPKIVQVLLCGGDWCRHLHGVKKKTKVEKKSIEIILLLCDGLGFGLL